MKSEIRCNKCNKVLNPNKITWLELSITDGNYYIEIPNGHISQGCFSFGIQCAKNQINEQKKENIHRS